MSAIIPYATSALGKRAAATLLAYNNKRVRQTAASVAGSMARMAARAAARRIQRSWRSRRRTKHSRTNRKKATRGYVKKAIRSQEKTLHRHDTFDLTPGLTDTLYNMNGNNEHILGDILRGDTVSQRHANTICLRGIHFRCEMINGKSSPAGGMINPAPLYIRIMLIGKKFTGSSGDETRMYSASEGNDADPYNYGAYPNGDGYLKHTAPLEKGLWKTYWQKRIRLGSTGESGVVMTHRYVNKFIKFREKKFKWMTSSGNPTGAGDIFPDMRLLVEAQKQNIDSATSFEWTLRSKITTYFCS